MMKDSDQNANSGTAKRTLTSGWVVMPIGDAVRIAEGQVDPRIEPYASMPNVGPENVEAGTGQLLGSETAATLGLISGKYQFKRGDIVYSKIRPYLRKVWLADFDGLCSADMYPLTVNEGFDSRFVSLFLLSDQFTNQVTASQARTGIPKVNREQLIRCSIVKMPIAEQRAIASVLSKIQSAVELEGRRIEKLRTLKAATMAKVFHEGLRGEKQKQTEIGEIPESWGVVPVGELFEIQLGKMLSEKARRGVAPAPYLRNANVQWGRIDLSEVYEMDFSTSERDRFSLLPRDVLVCEGGEPGRAALWSGEMENCFYQKALHRLRPRDSQVTPEFYVHWAYAAFQVLHSHDYSGAKTTIAHLPAVKLAAMRMPLPDPREQREIAAIFDIQNSRITAAEKRRDLLSSLFSSSLQRLMTGQLRVTELMKSPEFAHA